MMDFFYFIIIIALVSLVVYAIFECIKKCWDDEDDRAAALRESARLNLEAQKAMQEMLQESVRYNYPDDDSD